MRSRDIPPERDISRGTSGLRVTLDQGVCIGSGQCVVRCPDVFDQADDSGLGIVIESHPPQGWHDAVRDAALFCPTSAIALHDGDHDPRGDQ